MKRIRRKTVAYRQRKDAASLPKSARRLDLTVQLQVLTICANKFLIANCYANGPEAVYGDAATVTMRFVDAEESQHLNDTYRCKNKRPMCCHSLMKTSR